jgi:hypothetical protein
VGLRTKGPPTSNECNQVFRLVGSLQLPRN